MPLRISFAGGFFAPASKEIVIMKIATVVFDVGKVLFEWDLRYLFAKLIPDKGELEFFVTHVVTPEWHFQHDAGRALDDMVAERIAEFPELCGVEQELQNRSINSQVADDFGLMMREYAKRAAAVGAGFDMNPSPGNIKDGLITDAIKSAGAAKKAGSSPIVDSLGYGKYVTKSGLNLVCTPGNDVLATTGMAGAGATIQLFTTGLGTPTGNPICPMVKLSTNTRLAEKLPEIIDIDCGPIISGDKSVEEIGEEVLNYIIKLASGEINTKAMDLGQDDFMFWRRGVKL
ncbi:MAG: hypothetical protein EBR87_09430 [Cytophagia bacterium]|nr:hypothetical protein [Cytophagia bacterium]